MCLFAVCVYVYVYVYVCVCVCVCVCVIAAIPGGGGDGGDVSPPLEFFWGDRPPLDFESLKNIYSCICSLNTMKVIQSV